jgi:hypothetical protein
MLGNYSQHTRRHVPDNALLHGHWYVEPSGALYIIPTIGRAEGPAGPTLDHLNTLYGAQALSEVNVDVVANLTGLRAVHWSDKKFDPTNGYHLA